MWAGLWDVGDNKANIKRNIHITKTRHHKFIKPKPKVTLSSVYLSLFFWPTSSQFCLSLTVLLNMANHPHVIIDQQKKKCDKRKWSIKFDHIQVWSLYDILWGHNLCALKSILFSFNMCTFIIFPSRNHGLLNFL